MFDEDDPLLERVRSLCLALPEATEKIAHGRPWFSTRTGFCVYGGHHRAPGGGVGDPAPHAVVVKVDPAERAALVADERFFEPAYLAGGGWLGLELDEATDWDEVAELLEDSWRLTAPKRLVRQRDEQA